MRVSTKSLSFSAFYVAAVAVTIMSLSSCASPKKVANAKTKPVTGEAHVMKPMTAPIAEDDVQSKERVPASEETFRPDTD